jgi:transporter family protein
MKTWLVYSLLAMVCWGCYIVVAKVATSDKYCGLGPRWSALLMVCGIIFVIGMYAAFSKGPKPVITAFSATAGVSQGVLWALGMVFSLLAISAGGDISRLVPIFNCNTLIAVLLGIMVLQEIPDFAGMVKIIIGSLLIVAGGILVAR